MKIYFIFMLSILLLAILPAKSSFTFEEPQPETPSTPRVLNTAFYDDGTIVVRIVRVNYTTSSSICVEERLSIRTIYPNGIVKGFDLSSDILNIQPFNFCLLSQFNPLRFYTIKTNLLLITYVEAADENNPYSTHEDWGMIIDLDGVIRSKTKLSPSYVNTITNEWLPAQDSITLNVHRDNGFFRMNPVNESYLLLQQFKVDENDEIQSLAETYMNYTAYPIESVATMDGGYAVIYPYYVSSITTPFTPFMAIHGFFLENGSTDKQGPFVIYQTQTPISNITLLDCDFTKVGYGQTCILVINTPSETNQNTFIKIDFLSTGTVYNTTYFQNPADLTDFSIQALDYGGYFLFSTTQPSSGSNLNLYGYILDDQGNHYSWNLPYPALTNEGGSIVVLPNNTLAIPQPEFGQTWGLITTDLYKIESARDHGYENLHIFSTTPNINDIIDPSEMKSLTIKFYDKVELSPNRNITILQDDGSGNGTMRQSASVDINNKEFVNYIDDYTIEVTVIDSTFNQPNTKYYVLIDDGFVKSKDLQEPILGIQQPVWYFMTTQEKASSNSASNMFEKMMSESSIDGKVRLTSEGTAYYKSFKDDKIKVKEFFDNLTQELANAIPVGPDRITTNRRHEIDTTVSPEQFILSINIKKAKNKGEKSVDSIASDLNTLIKNKLITVIGSGEYSKYLDDGYGYLTIPRWLEEHWPSLLGTVLLNFFLLSFSFWRKSFAIYACGNAVEKFVTSILFTSVDASSVENIFTFSLFFVTFPFVVNLGFAFKIVIEELMRNDFRILLEKIRELIDDISEKGNNSTTEDDSDNKGLLEVDDRKEKVNKLTKVLKETEKELIKIKEELTEVIDLTNELKDVNESIKKLGDSNENEVKDIVKKLKKINNTIKELMQIEDFAEELIKVSKHLDELENLLELNKINVNKDNKESNEVELQEVITNVGGSNEVNKFAEEMGKNFVKEYNKIKKLMEGLREVKELKKQLDKSEKLMLKLTNEEPTSEKESPSEKELTSRKELIRELEKLNIFKKELVRINIHELEEERREFNDHANFAEEYVRNNDIGANDIEVVRTGMKDEENEESKRKNNLWTSVKGWGNKIRNKDEETTKGLPEKKYRRFSKWLRDYKNNQVIVVIFTILAGVDISHLVLLGSGLRIKFRNTDINFNAKLSRAAGKTLFWGGITNILIEDISIILIQPRSNYNNPSIH
ncbi:hypothetical protein GLOIN_2v1834901 [Rhizophagus clarus]|uniref:SbsA Ig-like domain-containing protein n=1 Tax=Rhizophagus clarus TaxID=94130 RepID=A0A8H3LFI8_9GLOM|nr:hypothetical protein GLOIN_2v1834901 [Rhizophagus clarus]